ncbi:hypothetical protein EVAR_32200_1 [Eumeta japonica]|uniref:Uncharacterized protein n=1 Tax=Eumeta variegata TaxID=151549 RepID=A0A4C1W0F7_EUMVA|nr:hypothetical protein EVAR_32200_1 [Eumeta japonica]
MVTSTSVNNKNIDSVRRMIGTNKHVTHYEIWASLGVGMSQIQILHKHLGMIKLCSRWFPDDLTEVQKTDRVIRFNAMITRLKEGVSNLVLDIVSGEETFITTTPEQSSNQP